MEWGLQEILKVLKMLSDTVHKSFSKPFMFKTFKDSLLCGLDSVVHYEVNIKST